MEAVDYGTPEVEAEAANAKAEAGQGVLVLEFGRLIFLAVEALIAVFALEHVREAGDALVVSGSAAAFVAVACIVAASAAVRWLVAAHMRIVTDVEGLMVVSLA